MVESVALNLLSSVITAAAGYCFRCWRARRSRCPLPAPVLDRWARA